MCDRKDLVVTYKWWLLYVHVYVMVRALLFACMLEPSCVCVRAHVCGGMQAWVHFPVCACECICKCVCVCACLFAFVCACVLLRVRPVLCVCVHQCVFIVYVCVGEGVVNLCVLRASIRESGFAHVCTCVCVCVCLHVCV